MKAQQEITIHGLDDNIARCEALGLSKCFEAYATIGAETIESLGFNANSGNIYIALENGICIASSFGQEVRYYVSSFEDGEEMEFDTYEEAENYSLEENN